MLLNPSALVYSVKGGICQNICSRQGAFVYLWTCIAVPNKRGTWAPRKIDQLAHDPRNYCHSNCVGVSEATRLRTIAFAHSFHSFSWAPSFLPAGIPQFQQVLQILEPALQLYQHFVTLFRIFHPLNDFNWKYFNYKVLNRIKHYNFGIR